MLVDRLVRYLDPAMEAAALATTMTAADLMVTPWHWCVYNVLGGAAHTNNLPIVAYTAYRSLRAMYLYPTMAGPATVAMLATPELQATSIGVRALLAWVPAFNFCIMWPVLLPRILAFYRHAKAVSKSYGRKRR